MYSAEDAPTDTTADQRGQHIATLSGADVEGNCRLQDACCMRPVNFCIGAIVTITGVEKLRLATNSVRTTIRDHVWHINCIVDSKGGTVDPLNP